MRSHMFCPNCGYQDQGESKFCKRCGTNLRVVSQELAGKPPDDEDDAFVRKLAIQQELMNQQELLKKRQGMITGGIISGCVGLGIMVFLTFMEGIKTGMVGMIPLMVGVGLTLSAVLLYKPKKYLQSLARDISPPERQIGTQTHRPLPSYPDSVTAETTRRLEENKPPSRITE